MHFHFDMLISISPKIPKNVVLVECEIQRRKVFQIYTLSP